MKNETSNNNGVQSSAIPLSVIVNNARIYLKKSVNAIINETHLPPYIMDGIICEVLADVRKQELNDFEFAKPSGSKGDDSTG